MSWFSRMFSAPEQKRSVAMVVQIGGAEPRWSDRDYKAFAQEGYRQNVVVHSAIERIAKAVATIDWLVEINGETVKDHPLIDLFKNPNPMQSGAEWWRQRISYLLLDGNSFLERVVVRGKVKELWPLPPYRVAVKPGDGGIPSAYIYNREDNSKKPFQVNGLTGDSDILHTKLFHPIDMWRGQSPCEAAAYAVDQHNQTMIWLQSLLQNSARPSGALVADSEQSLSDEEFNRLKAQIEEQYSGARNAGRPMLLEGGLDWKQMGLSPMDMEVLKIKDSAARDISLAFGVPPLLLNIPGDNTYSNYREARLGFYEDTIIPFITYELEEMGTWLAPFFGGARIRPDLDSIEALAEKRQKLWTMADESFDLTLNESRALKNLPPLPDPLGSTLMSEIKKGSGREQEQSTDQIDAMIGEAGYGKVD